MNILMEHHPLRDGDYRFLSFTQSRELCLDGIIVVRHLRQKWQSNSNRKYLVSVEIKSGRKGCQIPKERLWIAFGSVNERENRTTEQFRATASKNPAISQIPTTLIGK